jgi:cobalt-zinc-cadmium efflux system protein
MGSGHNHAGYGQGKANERAVGITALLTGTFMLAEVAGGLISGSLALLADAGHMLTDFGSLLLAWFAFRLARRPADWKRTYGFDRFSVLAAFVNGITLFAIAAWIVVEAIRRLNAPGEIAGGLMFWVAVAGLAVNLIAFWVLTRNRSENLNVRAAALHVLGDLLGSIAAIAASLVIVFTGWMPIDPLLSMVVVLLILRSAWRVVMESGHILLEGAPPGFDSRSVASDLQQTIPGVVRIVHIHAWSITQERPMVTLEAMVETGVDPNEVKRSIKRHMYDAYGIEHVTVEIVERRG